MCHVDGVSDDQMTCSDDSVLASLHLSLIAYMLRVGLNMWYTHVQHMYDIMR